MKVDIPKGWIAYLAFVWGLWIAAFCFVLDGALVWNMGYTFFFVLHIIANVFTFFVIWYCRRRSSEEEDEA